jgi:hypothetical protein
MISQSDREEVNLEDIHKQAIHDVLMEHLKQKKDSLEEIEVSLVSIFKVI